MLRAKGSRVVDLVIADFGRSVTRKIQAADGSPEDHIRAPFEKMITDIATDLGLAIRTIGETRLPDLSVRPDYAIDVAGARVGYVELKRPGYGVPDTWSRPTKHDKEQWARLQLLPNVLYTDGEQFAHYSFGKLRGTVARLEPGLSRAGGKLHAVDSGFARVMADFLLWEPEKPRSLNDLVRVVSKLCRLLRDDVATELVREQKGQRTGSKFTSLAADWRHVLFPNLTGPEFADQYAQTITFALLLARVEGVSFAGQPIGEIARLLGKKHSLMGRALAILTDSSGDDDDAEFEEPEDHSVALTTMLRVLGVVDWSEFPEESYELLYEDFLAAYDPALRRKSGVYYTPAALVSFLTRFVDDILRHRLGKRLGFADSDVIVVDPAMGTGSFLAEVIDTVATTIGAEQGDGAVAPYLRELSNRLIGFENQAAPYAIAELRIHSLLKKRHRAEVPRKQRRFLADTLDDPDAQGLPLIFSTHKVLADSRRGANKVKREEAVMVVLGNPPFKDKAKGTAPWIEQRSSSLEVASLSAFRRHGNGKYEYVLSNKYVYFWRWATWKAFDAHPDHPAGVVAFVCSAGFLAGKGFAGMREYLRRTADEGWIIDLSPEGHQPPMNTRFFLGNQQPICIAVFTRYGTPNPKQPARVYYTAANGMTTQKAQELHARKIDGDAWRECLCGWAESFRVDGSNSWTRLPSMNDLFPWATPGVKPNRTWVYATDVDTSERRWTALVGAFPGDRALLMRETPDSTVAHVRPSLPGAGQQIGSIFSQESGRASIRRIAHRPFDRKWIIADSRLLDRPRPSLWLTASARQIFVVEQHAHPISSGPALLFSALIPDMHCHSGRGGRVIPLFRDEWGTVPNVASRLLRFLFRVSACAVSPEDFVAYLAAVTAHAGFAQRFAEELRAPGIRVPLTGAGALWSAAVELGREVLWLHTFGERCVDDAAGRPAGSPRMPTGGPKVQVAIPDTVAGMPDRLGYDKETQTLHVGDGEIAPVAPEVMAYEVSGTRVVEHWFGYRRKKPAGVRSSPLNDIVATTWTAEMTTELLELLHVLGRCVALEPQQDSLLGRIMDGPLITIDDLTEAAVLPIPAAARKPPKPSEAHLFSDD